MSQDWKIFYLEAHVECSQRHGPVPEDVSDAGLVLVPVLEHVRGGLNTLHQRGLLQGLDLRLLVEMVRHQLLVLPSRHLDDLLRLLQPPLADEPADGLRNDPVEAEQGCGGEILVLLNRSWLDLRSDL